MVELELRVGPMQCYGVEEKDDVRAVWVRLQGNVKIYST